MATIKQIKDSAGTTHDIVDTKNTAGSTNSSSKLYLIGATSQAANPQTYSHDTAYVGTDGCLYSNSEKVITVSDMATTTTDGIMSSEDKTKLDRVIDYITFEVDLSEYEGGLVSGSGEGVLQSDTVPTLNIGDIVKIISNIEFPTNVSPAQVAVPFNDYNLTIVNSSGVGRSLGVLKFDFDNPYGNAEVLGRWDDRALRKYGGYFYVKITRITVQSGGVLEYFCTILYNNFSGLVSPYSEKTGLLLNEKNIDGIKFNGSSDVKHYGTCTTASATIAKTATISNFTLNTGSMVVIDFTYDNTAASPTLNISSTGAKSICQLSTSTSVGAFKRGCYIFVYDGTYWQMLNSVETAIDSNYALCSTSSSTKAKTATITGFTLKTGATALIRFTQNNTATSPTLNISGTGAKSLYLGSSTSVDRFNAGLYLIVYDGTYYRMINSVNATKISFATSSDNASYVVPFLDKTSYSGGTNMVYVGQSTSYPFSFNPSTGILTVKQTSSSDERLKDFVKDIDINFGDLKRIPKKYFTWKCDDEKHLHIGTSAQELEKIYPELVSEYGDEEEGLYKAVDYSTLSIIALSAIDKLNERIEYLENKLKELE